MSIAQFLDDEKHKQLLLPALFVLKDMCIDDFNNQSMLLREKTFSSYFKQIIDQSELKTSIIIQEIFKETNQLIYNNPSVFDTFFSSFKSTFNEFFTSFEKKDEEEKKNFMETDEVINLLSLAT